MRALLLLLAACVLVAATPSPTPPPCVSRAPVPERRHASGITLVGPLDLCALRAMGSIEDRLGMASHNARLLAESYPDALGHPWADRAAGQIVIAVVDAEGEAIARRWMREGAQTTAKVSPHKSEYLAPPEVAVRIRTVKRSYAQLEQIKDTAIGPGVADLPGGNAIYASSVDEEHNRVLLEVRSVNDAQLFALAARFGADAIVMRVDPYAGPFMPLGAALPDSGPERLPVAIAVAAAVLLGAFGVWALRRRSV